MCIRNLMATVLLTALCAVSAIAQCSDAEKAALEQFDKTWGEHSQKGNRAELERIYADDYAAIGPLGIDARKKDAIESAVRGAAANPTPPNVAFGNYIITCTPNTAVITHRNVNKVMMNGKENTFYSRSIHVLEKRGGRWQVVSNAGHPMVGDRMTAWNTEMDATQAYMRRDLDWFEKHTAPDFMGIDPDGKVYNRAQMLEGIKNGKAKYEVMKLSDFDIRREGDTAVITGVYHIKGQGADGKPMDIKTRFVRTLVKKDGNWQAIASHTTLLNDKLPEN